ncbi:MAG: GntR family transcriptional regulator [Rubritepida sp.]|nr:GntR family transcriptional regulator [Rubritepida sp.]
MSAGIAIVHADPLHTQVYEHLWTALADGTLAAGDRLKDTVWAERLGVSRTPVREALRKLAHDGALDPQGPGGYRVHRFSMEEVGELYRCRAALEALVAEEAAMRGNLALVDALGASIRTAEAALAADDLEALQPANGAFHRLLTDSSRNKHLRHLLEQTRRVVQMARRQVLASASLAAAPRDEYRSSMEAVVADHRALHAAIAAGDGPRAATLMRSHLLATAQDMITLLGRQALATDAA